MDRLSSSVLFSCTNNVIGSPMATAILSRMHGHRVVVDAVGARVGEPDRFLVAVME